VAHYYCELATLAMAKNDYHAVRGYLKQALTYDRNCVRASFLLGEAEYNSQHYAEAVKVFHKIRKQDPLFIADSVVLLARCYEALGQPNQLYRYLRDCMENYPSTGLLLVLADEMQRREGNAATARYLEDALKGQSSQRGMAGLLALYQADAEGETKQHMGTLKQLVEQRLHREPAYQCASCGHESRFNHWLCPGCHCWGQVKPVQY
jgi:lipopolysaccharide biosynthesis regulator YciM